MNTLLHRDSDDDDVQDQTRSSLARDREITLGTTMILGIFFALAVLAAVFFGFGYSMGAKHAMTTAALPGESGTGGAGFNAFKPAPGNPVGAPARPTAVPTTLAASTPVPLPPRPSVKAATPADVDAAPGAESPAPKAVRAAAVPAPAPVALNPAATGQAVVQVAAVSHQEDADLLVSTLKRRGYAVAIHQEPQDKLLHVQIGPFGTRKDADAMRLRLQGDGFNAIVKDAH